MSPWLRQRTPFPPLESALIEPNGLLAASEDVTPARLLEAYRRGIFPWYSGDQPVLWWSPDPRMVLYVDEFHVSHSLRKRVKRGDFEVRVDTAFDDVIDNCAQTPREGQLGTWITPAVIDAYRELYAAGFGHSVEAWRDGELVGGLYGLALDRMFFGESMFAHESDASKVALTGLMQILRAANVPLVDCQQETAHLASFGARPIARRRFAAHLAELIHSMEPPAGWIPGPIAKQQ